MQTNQLLTLREAAAYLRISRSSLYKKTEAGKIPAARVNGEGRLFYRREDLDDCLIPRTKGDQQ